MTKKRIILSFISLVISLFAFVAAAFAWFAVSDTVYNSPIDLSVADGIIFDYELYYYTVDDVYKYDPDGQVLTVYDLGTTSWITPTYEDSEDSTYNFSGIIMRQYDSLIPILNEYNNIILELRLYYDVDEDTTLSIDTISDTAISANAINVFQPETSRPYYLSEVSYVQRMISSEYSARDEGTNLYLSLKDDFSNEVSYPKSSFYSGGSLVTSISFTEEIVLVASSPGELYVYFNFSYYETKVLEILTFENLVIDFGALAYVRFFQDIKIRVQKEGVV